MSETSNNNLLNFLEDSIDIEDLQKVISKQEDLEILHKIDSLSLNDPQKQKELEIIDSCVRREDLDEYRRAREDSVLKANKMNIFSNYTAHSNKQNENSTLTLSNSTNNANIQLNSSQNGIVNKEITWGSEKNNADMNIGTLLRYFKENSFDCWIVVSSLYKYPSIGVHDYLCNSLYSMPDEEIEFYLVQLWLIFFFINFLKLE